MLGPLGWAVPKRLGRLDVPITRRADLIGQTEKPLKRTSFSFIKVFCGFEL